MRTARPLLLFAPLALAACQAQSRKEDSLWSSPAEALRAANPSDIAILPPVYAPATPTTEGGGSAGVPLEGIRQAAYRECLRRRYAPLSLDFVDRAVRTVEASADARGACAEDATLEIVVRRFDASRLLNAREVGVGADFFLRDGKSGAALWSAKADQTVSLRVEAEVLKDEGLLRRAAVERFVAYALTGLPAREPSPQAR